MSVIIPTRNRWQQLPRLGLRAALMQRDIDAEVIVVDDGSFTQPADVEGLADPRVQLVRHERRLGVASARNTGLRHARGEWIAFLDDDDMWAPNKLTFLLNQIESSGADFGYSSVLVLDRHMRPTTSPPPILPIALERAFAEVA